MNRAGCLAAATDLAHVVAAAAAAAADICSPMVMKVLRQHLSAHMFLLTQSLTPLVSPG